MATKEKHRSIAQILEDKIGNVFWSSLAGTQTTEDIKGDRKGFYIPGPLAAKDSSRDEL